VICIHLVEKNLSEKSLNRKERKEHAKIAMKEKTLSFPCENLCSDSYLNSGKKNLTAKKSLNRKERKEHAIPIGIGSNKLKEIPIFSFTESKSFFLSA